MLMLDDSLFNSDFCLKEDPQKDPSREMLDIPTNPSLSSWENHPLNPSFVGESTPSQNYKTIKEIDKSYIYIYPETKVNQLIHFQKKTIHFYSTYNIHKRPIGSTPPTPIHQPRPAEYAICPFCPSCAATLATLMMQPRSPSASSTLFSSGGWGFWVRGFCRS